MEKHSIKLSNNRLVYLDNDEIAEPTRVIHDFFSSSWLPDHLKTLKEWRNEAAFESDGSQGRNPVAILYGYELIIKLIEAAWLLKDKKLGKISIKENEEIAELFMETERKKLHDYPQHLTIRELMKPSSVLKETFRLHKLSNYRKILNIWLYDSLSTTFMEESLSKSEVIIVYEQLVKLFEAMWLINKRIKS